MFPALQFQVLVKVWGILNKHVGSCFQSIRFLFSRCLLPSVFKMMCSLLSEKSKSEVARLCPTLGDPMDSIVCQASLSMGFSRQEYWSGLPFLQEIFPTQESNRCFLHCRQTLYCLSHQGNCWLLRGI